MTRLKTVLEELCVNIQRVSISGQGPWRSTQAEGPSPTAGLAGLSCWPSSSPAALPGGCWSSPSPQSCPVLSVAGDKEYSHYVVRENPASFPSCLLLIMTAMSGVPKQLTPFSRQLEA